MSTYSEQMKAAWISTASGKPFHPFGTDPAEIRIKDIAKGLATTTRWRGQFGRKTKLYSVAQHSYIVSHVLSKYDVETRFLGLMHDAAEWVFGDVPSPVKEFMPEFAAMEENLLQRILERYAVAQTVAAWDAVHAADKYVAYLEAKRLLPDQESAWWETYTVPTNIDLDLTWNYSCAHPWTAAASERSFMRRFRELQKLR